MPTTPATPVFLVTGANGQVGHWLCETLAPLGRVVATDRDGVGERPDSYAVDLLDDVALRALVARVRPDVVVNPAAYTAVDKAESDAATARQINATAAATLAAAAAAAGAAFVHYSTDYVFDGSGSMPRDEAAATGPLSVYGETKLAGETAVMGAHPDAVILRTSWVFSEHGQNFVKTMLRLGAERESMQVVADQIGAPTSAAFLAAMTAQIITMARTSPTGWGGVAGRYHLCCAGETSWHGFALEIFRLARLAGMPLKVKDVTPIATAAWPTPARRPLNSRLDCAKFRRTFGARQPTWLEALAPVVAHLAKR